MTVRRAVLGVCATFATLLVLAAPALAHVSMETRNARPGAESEYTISVPNESETADTILVEVQLPEGLEVTSFKPGKGWSMRVESGALVIDGGTLAPGESRDFRFTAINPGERGELAFPAIQTYSDGEEVRWVGPEDSDRPAARVTIEGAPVTQPEPEQTEPAATEPPATQPAAPASPAPSEPAVPSATPTSVPSDAPAVPVDPTPPDESPGWLLPVGAAIATGAVVIALLAASRRRDRA